MHVIRHKEIYYPKNKGGEESVMLNNLTIIPLIGSKVRVRVRDKIKISFIEVQFGLISRARVSEISGLFS